MSTVAGRVTSRPRVELAGAILVGAAVAAALGVYARVHTPTGRPVFTLGFSNMLQMKAWLTTAALAFVLVQLITALWMWGRLPGAPAARPWVAVVHRWSGATAFVMCPCHGGRFNAQTGAVTEGPATRPLPAVPVTVRGTGVYETKGASMRWLRLGPTLVWLAATGFAVGALVALS